MTTSYTSFQIVGLTASVGIGQLKKSKPLDGAVKHIQRLCANLDCTLHTNVEQRAAIEKYAKTKHRGEKYTKTKHRGEKYAKTRHKSENINYAKTKHRGENYTTRPDIKVKATTRPDIKVKLHQDQTLR